jgi:membrane-associated phospholipid phosphatase
MIFQSGQLPKFLSMIISKKSNYFLLIVSLKMIRVIIDIYQMLGYFSIGALFCTLTSDLAKYNVGRLRPYFLTVCHPNMTDSVCKDTHGYQEFVTNYTCQEDADMIREARKSFLSGHSAFSFYTATFLIMYLHARLSSDAKLDLETKRYRVQHFKIIIFFCL